MTRKNIIIGNWKMHKTRGEALRFIETLLLKISSISSQVGLAVSFPFLYECAQKSENSSLWIGAQNMCEEKEGAFTGEVSATMLQDAGATFVLLGHSERRYFFQEKEETIHKKLVLALEKGLTPILCIGESEEHRKKDYRKLLQKQVEGALLGLPSSSIEKVILAYEPVWAIGTGKTATPEIAEEAHSFIRSILSQKWGETLSQKIPILYGGSVKPENIRALLAQKNIQGALVGGASLQVETFLQLIES